MNDHVQRATDEFEELLKAERKAESESPPPVGAIPCLECAGTGEVFYREDDTEACPRCGGKGQFGPEPVVAVAPQSVELARKEGGVSGHSRWVYKRDGNDTFAWVPIEVEQAIAATAVAGPHCGRCGHHESEHVSAEGVLVCEWCGCGDFRPASPPPSSAPVQE